MEEIKEKKNGKMDKWELEQCADTIIKAEEIKADKKKMAQLMPFLQGKLSAIKSLQDLIDRKKEVDEEDESEYE
jgi:hypothetical protein